MRRYCPDAVRGIPGASIIEHNLIRPSADLGADRTRVFGEFSVGDGAPGCRCARLLAEGFPPLRRQISIIGLLKETA